MAKSNNQKAKILYLEKLLCQTGEKNTISMQEILSILEEHDIRAERKSIYDDFDVLRSFGMDIRYRRGRNGGYYLVRDAANTDTKEEIQIVNQVANQIENQSDVQEESAQNYEWNMGSDSNEVVAGKHMKLLISENVKADVQKYFGSQLQYKESSDEEIIAVVPAVDGPQFFGWLTTMGKSVRIQKPRRIAQAYRDYLKTLAKEYKGI